MQKPSIPNGTRDFGPAIMARRTFILSHIKEVYQQFGFQPLETPAMENLSVLTGKYGEEGDQLLFKILNSGDFLKKVDDQEMAERNLKKLSFQIAEKGLRYDLTVPFARYVVMNRHELTLPFKRYQIQPVWRGDRPQKGRYREFYQCDADVIGTHSLICEVEIILIIKTVFKRLGINDYTIKVNHRKLLTGMAEVIGVQGNETYLFTAIDKIDKIGKDGVTQELENKGFDQAAITKLFDILSIDGDNETRLNLLKLQIGSSHSGMMGLEDLKKVLSFLKNFEATEDHVQIDPTLARGLSYYTGTIFEVKLNHVPIGSVSGGGRYDNLTQAFGAKETLTGIGISFGVDRLYDAMESLNLFPTTVLQSTQILVCHLDESCYTYGMKLVSQLRRAHIASEIFPDISKLKKQLDYANKKNIPYCLVIGSEEVTTGVLTLKHMETGEQTKVNIEKLVQDIQKNHHG